VAKKKRTPIKTPAAKPAAPTKAPTKGKGIRITSRLVDDLNKARDLIAKKTGGTGPDAWLNAPMRDLLSKPGWEPVVIQLILDDWINTLG